MKKIFYILTACLALGATTSCDWLELDNQESYNAEIHGRFIDSKTGENIQNELLTKQEARRQGWTTYYVDVPTAGIVSAYQKGWEGTTPTTWYIKYNGEYRNNTVFAGDYRIEGKACNFYELSQEISIKKGSDNEVNFTVTPYARVTNPKISFNGGKITATFGAEYGDPSKTTAMYDARLCVYSDRFVGIAHNNCGSNTDLSTVSILNCGDKVDSGETITLSIDTSDPQFYDQFKYKRSHYVRIAVCAVGSATEVNGSLSVSGTNSGSRLYNFSPIYKIDVDGTVSEVTDWEE